MEFQSGQLLTLAKSDQKFEQFLEGTFSKDFVALPIETLNANQSNEIVTFKLIKKSEIDKPSFFATWTKALRLRSFIIVLFPLFLVLVKNSVDKVILDPWLVLFAVLGVLGLFAAVSLQNDYQDHILGIDRINPQAGSRVLQQGWLTARQVKNASRLFLAISAICGLPLLFVFPKLLIITILTAVIGGWALFQKNGGFKNFEGGELLLGFLVGPLLCSGLDIALTSRLKLETFFLGVIWGALALFPLHLTNLENIMVNSRAQLTNMVATRGFDKGRRFIHHWWLGTLSLFIIYHFLFSGKFWTWFWGLTLVFVSMRFSMKLLSLTSPIGSEMGRVRKRGQYLFLITCIVWAFECMWILFEPL